MICGKHVLFLISANPEEVFYTGRLFFQNAKNAFPHLSNLFAETFHNANFEIVLETNLGDTLCPGPYAIAQES
jgi:hypothetical protein